MTPTLQDRVIAYNCFDLPGQPMSVHMGTSYLISDLLKAVEEITKERDEWVARHEDCCRLMGECTQDRADMETERDEYQQAADMLEADGKAQQVAVPVPLSDDLVFCVHCINSGRRAV